MSQEGKMPGEDKPRDFWDKLDIAFKVVQAAVVAVFGVVGSFYLQHKQETESKVQLYAQLMSNRERADSDLRKEMFNSIITKFLKPEPGELREQVFALEMLTYNFHDVIDLGALFKYMEAEITRRTAANRELREELQNRLQRAATEVIDKQLATLSEVGTIRKENVHFDDLRENPAGITVLDGDLCMQTPKGRCERTRKFFVHILDFDKTSRQLQVNLRVSSPDGLKDGKPEVETNTFWVAFSDFPLIDNIRLKAGDRVAIVLRRWEEGSAEIILAYFPGSRASLKDKVYYDEVVTKLVPGA